MAEGLVQQLSQDDDEGQQSDRTSIEDIKFNTLEPVSLEDVLKSDDELDPEANTLTRTDSWCDPCYKKNIYIPAHQFCQDCQEYHCSDCADFHGRFALGRSHSILHGSQMPVCQSAKCLQYENCSQHAENHADRFCIRHKELVCLQCASDAHTSCEIKTVPEVSGDIDETDVRKFKSLLAQAKSDIQMKLTVFEKNISEVENQRKLVEQKLKGIHEAILQRLNKLFIDSFAELESVHNKIKTYLSYQICTLNKSVSNIESSIKNLEKLHLLDVEAFLHLQGIAKDTRADIFKINENHKTVRSRCIKATINQKLQDFVDETQHLGTIEEIISDYQITQSLPLVTFPVTSSFEDLKAPLLRRSISNPKSVDRFNAKLTTDKNECAIVGIDVTSDGKVLLADFLNMNIKCFDSRGKSFSNLQLEYQPSDLAVASKDEAIVSLWCQPELYVLETDYVDMSVRKRIKLDAPISAVSVHKDKIIVNSRSGSGSVKLIDKCGRVYWSRSLDSEENYLFKHPRCNTCFKHRSKFFAIVTDYNKHSIIQLNGRTGDVKSVYRLKDEKDPFGVTSDVNGNIYVCYREANEIAVFNSDLEHERRLLSDCDGLGKWPNCIKYARNKVFVCYSALNESRNFIDCFSVI